MASVASQLIEEVTTHAQSDSLEDAREICADGTYFPNNLRTSFFNGVSVTTVQLQAGCRSVRIEFEDMPRYKLFILNKIELKCLAVC